mgnify:CR=1 FL=1
MLIFHTRKICSRYRLHGHFGGDFSGGVLLVAWWRINVSIIKRWLTDLINVSINERWMTGQ